MNPEDEIKINGEIYIRKGANKKGEVKITAEDMRELLCSLAWAPWSACDMRELLCSLAWAPWSACHYENAKRLLKSFFPGANWGDALENFTEIILSPPQEGSPK